MASRSDKSSKRRKKKRVDDTLTTSSSSSSESSSSDSEDNGKRSRRRRKHSKRHRSRERSSSRRHRDDKREKRRKHRRREKKNASESESESGSESERVRDKPEDVIRFILNEFSGVAADLEQLLKMIDDGQAVDISGLSEKSLVKHLRKLFLSLDLKESHELVFLLPPNVCPTLKVVGSIIHPNVEPPVQNIDNPAPEIDVQEVPSDVNTRHMPEDFNMKLPSPRQDVAGPKRRVIGPEMPSAELLAAAAKLTEAEAELRDAEMDGGDGGLFIGPPPPAVVKEAESANEAERFEEVTRIMGADVDSPYDVVGVNRNMPAENIKKRYWKLSLMVHPDKCPHPQANQAFIILNKAFKDLQDPDKRKAMDDKIIQKEEQERFKVELKEMREAAHWRRLQGLSMEGDEALLADMDVKVEKKRDEWMTTLPPERKPGVTTQSTKFNRNTKEGRGDTSAWTDTPLERAQRAKMNYLEAYNTATALASNDQQNQTTNMDAELVDKYNKAKRSKSLVEKHQETAGKRSKKKAKQDSSKDEWQGQHPWKPWDREKDLTAGRQNVKLDAENMSQGLSSRFSSGSFQRNFL
ncbi:hypothetical protein DCAR_0416571 [Daucus carota subsp. sativus]|uniref:J domain-containing protein n=1 Tax=Daucus carota subsp. sativus TaxID=79200 RepID=A0A165XL88_DAUCS|nr:PREDICTED: uncharacterized protein LOC108219180 isoform X2 [Daucus carota subsp. sativus]WOG97231.1 hypothetical protein DCAR_0416571 [Daucus carota subsp. sativus]